MGVARRRHSVGGSLQTLVTSSSPPSCAMNGQTQPTAGGPHDSTSPSIRERNCDKPPVTRGTYSAPGEDHRYWSAQPQRRAPLAADQCARHFES